MNTLNSYYPPALATPHLNIAGWFAAARDLLAKSRDEWRQRQALRAEWRTLNDLDDTTRRDLGLAERRLDAPAASSRPLGRLPWA